MKFAIKNPKEENIINLIRKIGYYRLPKREKQLSFIKPFNRRGYPRFHLYLLSQKKNQEIIFSIHLDQKKPVYEKAKAHSAEYEGEIVEKEVERIKKILDNN